RADLSEEARAEWIAALLSPFHEDVTKANILHEAARETPYKDRQETFKQAERLLVGTRIALGDKLLCNIEKISNMWLTDGTDGRVGLRYTLDGQTQTLFESVEPEWAQEVLTL